MPGKQREFKVEPELLEQDGVKHEFTGTLFVPTASEHKRIEREQAARETSPIVYGFSIANLVVPTKPGPVKVDMKTALRLRQRG